MAATFVAAYLFVLQSVVGAFALGAGPDQPPLDGFGNVICTHEGATELPPGNPHQKTLPNCCTLGCTMVSPALGAGPDTEALSAGLSFRTVAYPHIGTDRIAVTRDRSPANPRAPPTAWPR